MTRKLDLAILASDAVIAAAKQEGGEPARDGFRDVGIHVLRGRSDSVRLWGRAAEAS